MAAGWTGWLTRWFPQTGINTEFLEKASRTSFPVVQQIPKEIQERLLSFLNLRTTKQLKYLRQRFQEKLANREFPEHRHKPVGWALDRTNQFEPMVYGPAETLVYSIYDAATNYGLIHRVLQDLKGLRPDFDPKRALDFGSGPGTASWAMQQHFPTLEEYRLVETSQSMIDVSLATLKEFPGLSFRKGLQDMKEELHSTRYDLIVASCSITELSSEMERVATVSALWQYLSPNGMLVLLERGNPFASHNLRSARKLLLQTESCRVVAPCTHDMPVR